MHEMSLCEGVLQILRDHATTQGFTRVKTVWLEIGT
ncbi:MAG TPA: hydrogenase maturation nickel metallochaperone HypA, partial [Chromatiaceae bacterium]|nr:hydrogenase maturation nickel metallochaperone HypA [Chromatiaceae bacterium]